MDRNLLHCTGVRDQEYPQEKEMQKDKMVVSEEALQIAEKRREVEDKEKRKDIHLNANSKE